MTISTSQMVFFESEYLRQTVGPFLAGGCAATAAARPADPVEHLANWLLRSVTSSLYRASDSSKLEGFQVDLGVTPVTVWVLMPGMSPTWSLKSSW